MSVLLLGVLAMLAGCRSYTEQSAAMAGAWQRGSAESAARLAERQADRAAQRDAVLWRLEQGATLAAAGRIADSNRAFDAAEELITRHDSQARLQLGSQTAGMFTNQATLPYRGRASERILLNSYKALNHLLLDDPDSARVELNRALQRQQDAVQDNRRRLEQALGAAEQARAGQLQGGDGRPAPRYDVDRAQADPVFATATGAELAQVDARILPYADYVNPFAVFLDGLYFSHHATGAADLERALKSFERVAGMSPGRHIEADRAMAERMASGLPAEPVTYVLFATGSAPLRDEVRFEIPLFLVSSVSYIAAAFPRLVYQDRFIPVITAATADGATHASERLASMDAIVSQEFRNEWPAVLTTTLLGTATKVIAGKLLEDSVRNEDWSVQLLAMVVNIGYQISTSRADTRSWSTLPKEFAYLRLPTPEDGVLTLQAGRWTETVRLQPGRTNIILVRSVNDSATPLVNQRAL